MTMKKRVTTILAATALVAVPLAVSSAPTAEAASWVCAYRYDGSGRAIGKACFKGRTAQVCDLKKDGVGITGTFSVRGVGVRSFKDGNGAASPCAYRTYSATVGSATVR